MPSVQNENKSPHRNQYLSQILIFVSIGFFLFLIIWLITIAATNIYYSNKIFPGVFVADTDLSGLSIENAAIRLFTDLNPHYTKKLLLYYDGNPIEATSDQIGIQLDIGASVRKAYRYGRAGSIRSFFSYHLIGRFSQNKLAPVVAFNQQKARDLLQQIAMEYDQPVQDAGLEMAGIEIRTVPSQEGKSLNIAESLNKISEQIEKNNFSVINLSVDRREPEIQDASEMAEAAWEILSKPFNLVIPEGYPDASEEYRIEPEELAPMLAFQRAEGENPLSPGFHEEMLVALLLDIATDANRNPLNARFMFNDETRELELLESARDGRELDIQATLSAIQQALETGKHSSDLIFNIINPQVENTATAQDLGITELISEQSSYFYGSDSARIQNIQTAASEFHGLLVPPGAVFSMAEALEEVSLDKGYTEALIIFNGRTIEGVGGGVCQVSTTLFRTAFYAGFPINERHPHAYRVSYYEKTAGNSRNPDLAGMDATVYVPLVDLKFTNDTPYWLLMETDVDPAASRITWKFYSTPDGRSVEFQTTGPINIVEPKKPLCIKNADLDPGELKRVDYEADGADVRVDRWVYRDGDVLHQDTFYTHYQPWRAIYEYGPGTDGLSIECEIEEN